MAEKTGCDCKLYVGPAGSTAGTTLVNKVKDNELNLKAEEIEISSRAGSGWKDFIQGLKEWGASFDIIYDTTDAAWQALNAAFIAGTSVGVSILDDDLTTGSGMEGAAIVTEMTRGEPLNGALTSKCTIKGKGKPSWKN